MRQKLDSGKELMVQMKCLKINIEIATSNVHLNLWKCDFILEPIPHVFCLFTAVFAPMDQVWRKRTMPETEFTFGMIYYTIFLKMACPQDILNLMDLKLSLIKCIYVNFGRMLMWGHLELNGIYSIDEKPMMIFSSVQFSLSVMSDSLRPRELQHTRPPCPSPTPRVDSNSCPLSQRCHSAISSSVIPFSSCPQSLSASGSFPVSQRFASSGQSIGVSASASVLPINTQDWSPLGWTGWISLQPKGLSRVFSNTTVQRHQFFGTQLSS